jgi:sec-independent protein translocase protein TatA
MGGFSWVHWLVVGIVLLLLFGKGRFSDMMGDVAKGIKSFKKGMTEEEETPPEPPAQAPRRIAETRPPEAAAVHPQPGATTIEPAPAERGPAAPGDGREL